MESRNGLTASAVSSTSIRSMTVTANTSVPVDWAGDDPGGDEDLDRLDVGGGAGHELGGGLGPVESSDAPRRRS